MIFSPKLKTDFAYMLTQIEW